MSASRHHIIRRQVIELELSSQRDAYRQQRHVSELFQAAVVRQLGEHFDDLGLGDTVLRIPKLEIDLGSIPAQSFDRDFTELCTSAIKQAVEEALQAANLAQRFLIDGDFKVAKGEVAAKLVTPQSRQLEVLTQFLQTGTFPVGRPSLSWQQQEAAWEKLLDEHTPDFITLIQRLIKGNSVVTQRLFRQFSVEWIGALLFARYRHLGIAEPTGGAKHLPDFIEATLSPTRLQRHRELWARFPTKIQAIITVWAKSFSHAQAKSLPATIATKISVEVVEIILTRPPESWAAATKTILTKIATPSQETVAVAERKTDPVPEKQTKRRKSTEKERTPVNQAGLVLLHPFLPILFEELELLDGKTWKNETSQERAMHLLVYLATGTDQQGEEHFGLPKLLCNWSWEQPVNRFLELTGHEKTEADQLLAAVVSHWSALGNSSIDGLREGFLQRNGLVEERQDGLLLRIERKGQDLLIDKLPWGIGFFQLPWMETQISVEW